MISATARARALNFCMWVEAEGASKNWPYFFGSGSLPLCYAPNQCIYATMWNLQFLVFWLQNLELGVLRNVKKDDNTFFKMASKRWMAATNMSNLLNQLSQKLLGLELQNFVSKLTYCYFQQTSKNYLGLHCEIKMAAKCPINWPLRNYGLILIKLYIQGLLCIAIQITKSDLTSDPTWPPFWPNFGFWEHIVGFSSTWLIYVFKVTDEHGKIRFDIWPNMTAILT